MTGYRLLKSTFPALFLLGTLMLCHPASARNILTDNINLSCVQDDTVLDCDYRMFEPEVVDLITAFSGENELSVHSTTVYPAGGDTTAILFLIDTSDPARQNAVNKGKQHIRLLIKQAKPHHKPGLASFDKTLEIESGIGDPTPQLLKSLEKIRAKGQTTELYRSVLKAISYLQSIKAQRKVLYLLSDGQAEDMAYFHSDVVNAARESGIVINTIGYPRSAVLSVALQTLRRLSEETGGSYVGANVQYGLNTDYFGTAYKSMDSGGRFSINLDKSEKDSINIKLAYGDKIEKIALPVEITSLKATTEEKALQGVPAEENKPDMPMAGETGKSSTDAWFRYDLFRVFVVILLIAAIIVLASFFRIRNSALNKGRDDDNKKELKPYAYLIAKDKTQYPITRTTWRIGRSENNELPLDDASVSRMHAEIHRNDDGSFGIIDMGALNTIYINNKKVKKAILQEGDIIDIGDITLIFTQQGPDNAVKNATILQQTRLPDISDT